MQNKKLLQQAHEWQEKAIVARKEKEDSRAVIDGLHRDLDDLQEQLHQAKLAASAHDAQVQKDISEKEKAAGKERDSLRFKLNKAREDIEESNRQLQALVQERNEHREKVKILMKERDSQSERGKEWQAEKSSLAEQAKHWEKLAEDRQKESVKLSATVVSLERAIVDLRRTSGLEQDWERAANELKKERDNLADTIKYWEKMVVDLQTERDTLAAKLKDWERAVGDLKRERDLEREALNRDQKINEERLLDLERVAGELAKERDLARREMLRERELARDKIKTIISERDKSKFIILLATGVNLCRRSQGHPCIAKGTGCCQGTLSGGSEGKGCCKGIGSSLGA